MVKLVITQYIQWAELKKETQHPTIEHGFRMNAIRDQSRYQQQQRPGKPYFGPDTKTATPRPRGGRNPQRQRQQPKNTNKNGKIQFHIFLPPTNVKQKHNVPFNRRPKYFDGRCEKCFVPGHHESDCDKLQQHRDTIKHYAKRFLGKQQKNGRINQLQQAQQQQQEQIQHANPPPTSTNPIVPTGESQHSFFDQQ